MTASRTLRILHSPDELAGPLPHPVATVGNFDGVHLGHRRILETLCARAREDHGTSLVITFDPHPQKVLQPDAAPRLIVTEAQKEMLLAGAGLQVMLKLPFTRELACSSAEQFVQHVLLGRLKVREIHIGRNFRFGRNREGDFETLQRLGAIHGFRTIPVPGVRYQDRRISSSRIRRALAAGDVTLAAALLGREEELVGEVIHGDGRGRTVGFPTANLRVANELIPLTGVYVTRFILEGREIPSLTNIGSRPTFPGAAAAVESHLLDFDGDLYGRQVALRFARRLRDEIQFPGIEALKAQIIRDIAEARQVLAR
ncbi:MAG: bifunctional riboflavin kinase/FAD synthetase [Acidobacteriota bacterium]